MQGVGRRFGGGRSGRRTPPPLEEVGAGEEEFGVRVQRDQVGMEKVEEGGSGRVVEVERVGREARGDVVPVRFVAVELVQVVLELERAERLERLCGAVLDAPVELIELLGKVREAELVALVLLLVLLAGRDRCRRGRWRG